MLGGVTLSCSAALFNGINTDEELGSIDTGIPIDFQANTNRFFVPPTASQILADLTLEEKVWHLYWMTLAFLASFGPQRQPTRFIGEIWKQILVRFGNKFPVTRLVHYTTAPASNRQVDVQAMQFGIPGYDGLVWDVSVVFDRIDCSAHTAWPAFGRLRET